MPRRMHGCVVLALLTLTACYGRRSVNTEAKPVSFGIFEVIDCKPGSQPMPLRGATDKYCLAAEALIRETDVRLAQSRMSESGQPELNLYFTLQTGRRLHEATERIYSEHLKRGDLSAMAVVVDGTLVAAPTLRSTIDDSLVLQNFFTQEEADGLAASLMASRTRPGH